MAIAVGEVVRVAVRQRSVAGTDILNVFHFQHTGTAAVSETAFLNAMAIEMSGLYLLIEDQIPVGQTAVDLKCDVVELVGGEVTIVRNVGTISWGAGYNPAAAGETYALGVGIGVLLRTLVGKVYGRKTFGQVAEVTINGNALATGNPTTNFTDLINNILGPYTVAAQDFSPGILSTRTLQFEEFVEAEVAPEVFYQRRRAIRSGS